MNYAIAALTIATLGLGQLGFAAEPEVQYSPNIGKNYAE
jgi:hypothetical protein